MIPLSNIDATFWPALVQGAASLGVDPRALANVMMSESDLNPRAYNANGGAVGINQFMPRTLDGVAPGMDPDDYRGLSASEQLHYALKFWGDLYNAHPGAREGGARDLYWLNFLPATYVPNAPDDYVITTNSEIVSANPGLVLDGDDGVIRPAGLVRALDSATQRNPARWNAAMANIDELTDTFSAASSFASSVFSWKALSLMGLSIAALAGLATAFPHSKFVKPITSVTGAIPRLWKTS